jgi:putative transposase
VGRAKRVRFKGRHQLDTVEGKTITSGIRWCSDHVAWKGLVLPARIEPRDLVLAHGRSDPVKYVRLVRRKLGLRNRLYAQLVCEGIPHQQPQLQLGQGIVGLELGPGTIAVVAEEEALLQPFCPEVVPDAKALRRRTRHLDRKLRANNPANYDERGRVKKGRKRWHASKRQRKAQARRRELNRKLTCHEETQSWATGPSGTGPRRHLPPGADLLSRLAKNLRPLDSTECPSRVCFALVSPGGHVLAGRSWN